MASRIINLNNSSPAANSGFQNAEWQLGPTSGIDPTTGLPIYPASAEVPNTGGVNAKTANYTAVAADCGKLLTFNSSSALTITLPSTPPFGQWEIDVENTGTGTLFVARGGSTTIDGSASSLPVTLNTGLRIKTDGTNYFSIRGGGANPSTYPGSGGALTLTSAASPSTLNLTTEGTFDWLCPDGSSGLPWSGNVHMKKVSGTGFVLATNFNWVVATGSVFTQNFVNPQASATAADDVTGTGLTSVIGGQGVFSSASGILSIGFRLAVPAGQVPRTLRIYSEVFSGTVTCTASLSDGSATTATATLVSAAGVSAEGVFTITFNAARDGQFLTVSVLLTTNLGSTPNVKFFAATMA